MQIDPTSYSGPRTTKHTDQVFVCEKLHLPEVAQLDGVMKNHERMLLAVRLLNMASKKTKIIAKSEENWIWEFKEVSLSQQSQRGHPHYMFVGVNEEGSSKLCYKHSRADL